MDRPRPWMSSASPALSPLSAGTRRMSERVSGRLWPGRRDPRRGRHARRHQLPARDRLVPRVPLAGDRAAVWRIHRHIGMGGDQLVAALCGDEVERERGDAIRDAEKDLYQELIDEVEPLEGATELIRELKEPRAAVVLASSAKEEEVEHYVDLLDARELADGWTTSADVEATKPEPDLVLAAVEKADAEDGAVMVGDSTFDCEAAKRAELETDRRADRRLLRGGAARRRRGRRVRVDRGAARAPGRDAPRLTDGARRSPSGPMWSTSIPRAASASATSRRWHLPPVALGAHHRDRAVQRQQTLDAGGELGARHVLGVGPERVVARAARRAPAGARSPIRAARSVIRPELVHGTRREPGCAPHVGQHPHAVGREQPGELVRGVPRVADRENGGHMAEKLGAYRKKRDFERTSEPAGGERRRRGRTALRGPGARRHPAALGPAPGARRRAGLVGAAARDPRPPGREPARRAHRGPPARVPRVRGRDPEGRSTAPGRWRSSTAAPTSCEKWRDRRGDRRLPRRARPGQVRALPHPRGRLDDPPHGPAGRPVGGADARPDRADEGAHGRPAARRRRLGLRDQVGRHPRGRLLRRRAHAPSRDATSPTSRPRYPELRALGRALGGHRAVLDGEIVAFDERRAGRASSASRRACTWRRTPPCGGG